MHSPRIVRYGGYTYSILLLRRTCANGSASHQPHGLFTAPNGALLRLTNFRRRHSNRAAADVGLAGLTPHDLRHTAASLAVSAGANVKSVQRILRHASAAMTLDVYAELFDDDLDAVAERMDAAATVADVPPLCPEATVVPLTLREVSL